MLEKLDDKGTAILKAVSVVLLRMLYFGLVNLTMRPMHVAAIAISTNTPNKNVAWSSGTSDGARKYPGVV